MNFVDIAYSTPAIGLSNATMAARMAAVVLPREVIAGLGLRGTSDATPVATPTVRTIQSAFGPTGMSDATAVLQNDGTVVSITPGNRGNDYIRPPRVFLTPAVQTPAQLQAFLRVNAVTINTAGIGYV